MMLPPIYIISGFSAIILLILYFQRSKSYHTTDEFTESKPKSKPKPEQKPTNPLPPIIGIYLVTDQPIDGSALLQFFMTHKLQYSNQQIFQGLDGDCARFSVATLSSPGTFDLNTMSEQTFNGLSFFLQTTADSNTLLEDFDCMCRVIFDAKDRFLCHLKAHDQTEITLDHFKSWRASIHEIESV